MKSLDELLDLSERSAIVTGGAMGIGLGITRRLAEAGASVLIADLDGDAARHEAKLLGDEGLEVESVPADVADEHGARDVIGAAVRLFGGVDILVNNAGIYPNLPLGQLEPAAFDRVMRVNLGGVFLYTKYVAEQMKAQGRGGRIINVTSIDAVHPSMVGLATYDATKHGVWGFTKSTALELAPYGIQVNAVAPGGIDTPGVQKMNAGGQEVDMQALIAAFLAKIPMGRMGEPDDIGKVVLFLASDLASYMTGSQVVVDGGALLS
jgi:2-dehydro-3-deoxy-D-gluconate 5-dehydrogenase